MNDTNKEEEFKIRSYGFGELAQLYFPTLSKKSASWQLTLWIKKNEGLNEILLQSGRTKKQRLLSPAQVLIIVEKLGIP
jgi:hypothetical protein